MALDITAKSRAVGVGVQYKDFESGRVRYLPQRVALIGQGNTAATYSTDKQLVTGGAAEVASIYGYGSPLHLAAKQLFPVNGDGIGSVPVTIYPMVDDGSGVIASGDITAAGTAQNEQGTYIVKINNIPSATVVIPAAATPADSITLIKTAIDANLDMPVTTGPNTGVELVLDLDSKWKGESANDIFVEIEGVEDGITFTVTQLTGGTANPDVDTPLGKIGVIWETMIINCLNYDDTTTLDKYKVYGEGRWDDLEKKPLVTFSATADNLSTRTAITDARKSDRINSLISTPGCNDLPCEIAARAVTRIARSANNNPPQNYNQRLTGLVPGTDSEQENYTQRNTAINAGSGTTVLVDGEIELNDTVTMYHPDGEIPPAYQYVVDIVKLQNVIYNVRLIFESDEWKGAPLLPDATPSTNRTVKKPKNAVTVLGVLATNLGLVAIIADPAFTQSNLTVDISSQNPKRLDIVYPIKLSGNTEVISTDIFFGFFYGT
jgi:phage tail sheath gpL-like